MKSLSDLNKKQIDFIIAHALWLFEATMLDPNDDPENILASDCPCCVDRRNFLKEVIKRGDERG